MSAPWNIDIETHTSDTARYKQSGQKENQVILGDQRAWTLK